MKKRLTAIILAVVLVFALACPSVGAANKAAPRYSASYETAVRLVDTCNKTVEALIRCAQLTRCDDAAAAVFSANLLIGTTIAAVRALGCEVACTYTQYVIDGHTYLIDPLRVINPLDQGGGSGSGGNGD